MDVLMAATTEGLRTVLSHIRGILEGGPAALKLSPSIFSVQMTPKGLQDASFVLDIQSKDTGKYRNGAEELLRIEHLLKVTVAKVLIPMDQFKSQCDGLDLEEVIIRSLCDEAATAPFNERVAWVSTTRTPTPTREHIVSDIVFRIEHDWSFST